MNILIDKIPPLLPDNTYVALDVELFGAEKHRLHRPTGKFACLTLCPDGENVYLITDHNIVDIALGRVDNCVWSFHNAQFDLQQLRRWSPIPPRKKLWCSLIIERLLWSGYYDRFALKDLSRRYLGQYLEKEAVELFSTAQELDEDTIHYAATDAITQWRITKAQQKKVKKRKDVRKIWKGIDAPAIWAYLDFLGFRIDVAGWEELAVKNRERYDEMKATFPFNPNSSKAQVQPWFREHGAKGVTSADKKSLAKFIKRYPNTEISEMAERLLEYSALKSPTTTYGMNFINLYLEEENDYQVIHSNFSVTGARTGRNSSSNPNMQNIPIRDNPEFRKPWIARPGNKLIVADWSAQEARVHAFLTQDKTLKKIFKKNLDVYTEAYNLMYNENIKKSNPLRNEIGKPAFLGATYGQSAFGVAEEYGMELEEAEDLQARFWRAFPDSDIWCKSHRRVKTYSESVMGRRMWANPYNDKRERNNLNDPHQSTGGDMIKLEISLLHQNWNFDCPFGVVAPVHDEIILDVPEELAPEIAEFVSNTMVEVAETMCKGIPFRADAKIVDNWLQGKE
jgi:DNA polymerase-1